MYSPSAGGSALNGLVGGILLGTDFSRQRRSDRTAAEDRARKIRLEDADRRIAAEDRSRAQGIQDLALAEQYGLQYHRPMGVEQLRTGVGDALKTFDDLVVPGARETELRAREMGEVVPDGFTRIGPSQRMRAEDRAVRLRSSVGQMLGMSGDQVEALSEYDLLDNMMGAPSRPNLQRFEHDGGQYTFDPSSGRVAPIEGLGSGPVAADPSISAALDGLGLNPQERAFVDGLSPDEQRKFILDQMDEQTPAAPGQTDANRRAAFALPRAERGFQVITDLVGQFGGAPGISSMLGTGLTNFAKKTEVQQFNVAAQAIVSAFLRLESGGAITPEEIEAEYEKFIPQIGDREETVALKLQILEDQMGALREAAGQGRATTSTPQPSSFSPDNTIMREFGGGR